MTCPDRLVRACGHGNARAMVHSRCMRMAGREAAGGPMHPEMRHTLLYLSFLVPSPGPGRRTMNSDRQIPKRGVHGQNRDRDTTRDRVKM